MWCLELQYLTFETLVLSPFVLTLQCLGTYLSICDFYLCATLANKFEHAFLLSSACWWKCSCPFLFRMCPGGITTLQGCEQAIGQLFLPAATVLDRNSYFIIYLKPSLLPGPHIILTLVAIFWLLLTFLHTLNSSFLNSWCQRSPCSLCCVRWVSEGGTWYFTVSAMHPVPEKWYV